MVENHYKTVARSPADLLVRGKYFEISIEGIILEAEVLTDRYSEAIEHFLLFKVVCSNLWEHIVSTRMGRGPRMIDSHGFQHTERSLLSDAVVHKAKGLKKGTS